MFQRRLMTNQKLNFTKTIEITGLKNAILSMENGKQPRIDKPPTEVYQEFFEQIKHDLQKRRIHFLM